MIAERAGTFEDENLRSRALLRDLHATRPFVYWTDLLLKAQALGGLRFGVAASLRFSAVQLACAGVAVVALYRALCQASFTRSAT